MILFSLLVNYVVEMYYKVLQLASLCNQDPQEKGVKLRDTIYVRGQKEQKAEIQEWPPMISINYTPWAFKKYGSPLVPKNGTNFSKLTCWHKDYQ